MASPEQLTEERLEFIEAMFYPLAQEYAKAKGLGERVIAMTKVNETLDEWLDVRNGRTA